MTRSCLVFRVWCFAICPELLAQRARHQPRNTKHKTQNTKHNTQAEIPMPTPNQPNNPNQPKKPVEKPAEKTGDTANKPTAGGNGQPSQGAKPNQSGGQTGAQKPTPN